MVEIQNLCQLSLKQIPLPVFRTGSGLHAALTLQGFGLGRDVFRQSQQPRPDSPRQLQLLMSLLQQHLDRLFREVRQLTDRSRNLQLGALGESRDMNVMSADKKRLVDATPSNPED